MRVAASPWDVIIIGAGPAGSTAATLLGPDARVLVLEKSHFPRFHIGESLLPAGLELYERLGVAPDPDTFLFKQGAEFVCEASGRHATFTFDEALPGPARSAWHVDRARFDTLLRDRAIAAGAEVRHGEKVTDLSIDPDGVTVTTSSGTERARYLIDATGQDRLLARRHRSAVPYPGFGKAAVFTHFQGLNPAAMEEIGPGGDIRIMVLPGGWAWLIPLPGGRLSVGIVTQEAGARAERLTSYLQASPMLRRWTHEAEMSEVRIARNFSYRNRSPHGSRFACIGDAACFLDPVFSSGVTLAMQGASQVADLLRGALAQGREHDPDLLDPFAARMEVAYRVFGSMIDRFYNTPFADTVFFGVRQDGPLRRGVISVLAGDVWREDNPFVEMLLNARRRTIP